MSTSKSSQELNLNPINEITSQDFLNAVYGDYNNQIVGMSILTGNEIRKKRPDIVKAHRLHIDSNFRYLLLDNIEVESDGEIILDKWDDSGNAGKINITFLFHKCILPPIKVKTRLCNNWSFSECVIDEGITLDFYGEISYLFISNCKMWHLYIRKLSLCQDIAIYDTSIGNISISDKSECGLVGIHDSQVKQISVRDNSLCRYIHLHDTSRCGRILVDNRSECGGLWVDHSNLGSLWIEKESLSNTIRITGNSQCQRITNYGICEALHVSDSICEIIDIKKESYNGDISLRQSTFTSVSIDNQCLSLYAFNASIVFMPINNCNMQKLVWHGGGKADLHMTSGSIRHLSLQKTTLSKDISFSFNDVAMSIVQIEYLLVQGQLIMRNIYPLNNEMYLSKKYEAINSVEKLDVQKYATEVEKKILKNYKNIISSKFLAQDKIIVEINEEFKTTPLFRVVNSSLGKTEITGSNLSSFIFEYRNSKLLECFISGSQIPRDKLVIYQNNHYPTDSDSYEQRVSFYNQLRKLNENIGDIIETSWYHSKSLYYQQKLLQLAYKSKKPYIKRHLSEEAFTLLIFRLNKLSNNHGESWRQAFLFTFLISFVIFSLYYASIFYDVPFRYSQIVPFIGSFFCFFDITHKLDFLVRKEVLSPLTIFIDLFGRIIITYGIYQFIAAFRRYNRKVV